MEQIRTLDGQQFLITQVVDNPPKFVMVLGVETTNEYNNRLAALQKARIEFDNGARDEVSISDFVQYVRNLDGKSVLSMQELEEIIQNGNYEIM